MSGNTTSNPTFDFRPLPNYSKGALAIVSVANNVQDTNYISFLLNPETISESLTGGWIHKTVPGQNDPISSWVGNGVRTINLTLLVIKDTSIFKSPTQAGVANTTQKNIISTLGATVANISIPVLQGSQPKEPALYLPTSQTGQPLTISQDLDRFRQLRYAGLDSNNLYSVAPPLVKFYFDQASYTGNSTVSNPTLGIGANSLGNVYWTVDAIEITTTKWTADLQPLEAQVKLTLVQFNDKNYNPTTMLGDGQPGGFTLFTA